MPVNAETERRRFQRVSIDLPIRYNRVNESDVRYGRAMNLSQGGLLMYSLYPMDVDEKIKSKIFFLSDSEMDAIEMKTQVVWTDLDWNEAWGDHRSGLRLVDISLNDMCKLRNLLTNLSQ